MVRGWDMAARQPIPVSTVSRPRVTIVGAGWAGLAAGVELSQNGFEVECFESAPQIGGRARTVVRAGREYDNGQHLLIGAYHETLRLIRRCGGEPQALFMRAPMALHYLEPTPSGVIERSLSTPGSLPAPLHMAWGILGAKGFPFGCRRQLIMASLRFMRWGFRPPKEAPLLGLLEQLGQRPETIRLFWEPLVLATLNTPISKASATLFLRVLRDSFNRHNRDSDSLLPSRSLSHIFPQLAQHEIESNGGSVQPHHRVTAIHYDEGVINSISVNGQRRPCEHLILATPPHITTKLLPHQDETAPLIERLKALEYQPIVTLYLQYPATKPLLSQPYYGLHNTLGQWVFDRGYSDQPGTLAVVISAEGPHLSMERSQLIEAVEAEITQLFPQLPPPIDSWMIQEKRATFASTVGVNELRPGNQTAVPNLWLCGDYTDTQYPATLEGAVRSGVASARQIIDNIPH